MFVFKPLVYHEDATMSLTSASRYVQGQWTRVATTGAVPPARYDRTYLTRSFVRTIESKCLTPARGMIHECIRYRGRHIQWSDVGDVRRQWSFLAVPQ